MTEVGAGGGESVRRESDKVLSHSRSLWVWQESSAPVAPCEPLHCVCVRAGVGSGKITAPLPLPRLPGSYTTALMFVRGWFTQQKPYFLYFILFSSFLPHKNGKPLLHLRRSDSAWLLLRPCLLSVPLSRAPPHSLPPFVPPSLGSGR